MTDRLLSIEDVQRLVQDSGCPFSVEEIPHDPLRLGLYIFNLPFGIPVRMLSEEEYSRRYLAPVLDEIKRLTSNEENAMVKIPTATIPMPEPVGSHSPIQCTCESMSGLHGPHEPDCPMGQFIDKVENDLRSTQAPTQVRPEQVRGSTHGDYNAMAQTAQHLKSVMYAAPNWDRMAPVPRESLDMIATKIARILHGDFSNYDHWDDLRGYVQLVLDRMIRK